jgi:hypothetical protein
MLPHLLADGLEPADAGRLTPGQLLDPGEGWIVALFVTPTTGDFHFYRLDGNSYWTHKAGPGCFVRGCDEAGRVIPREGIFDCDAADYRFCRLFRVPPGTRVR